MHIFVGMIEAPLLIRPYLAGMSRGEVFAMMSCGMAGVAGTVMVIYGACCGPVVPDALASDHRRLGHQHAGRPGRVRA